MKQWTLAQIFFSSGNGYLLSLEYEVQGSEMRTPDGLVTGYMKRLIDLLPLPQSQANSGSIYHIYSYPQAPSFAQNIFLVSTTPYTIQTRSSSGPPLPSMYYVSVVALVHNINNCNIYMSIRRVT